MVKFVIIYNMNLVINVIMYKKNEEISIIEGIDICYLLWVYKAVIYQ